MKKIIVFVLLISILLVIGILYYDSYSCAMNRSAIEPYVVKQSNLTDKQLQEINKKYNFSVSDAELPQFKQLLLDNRFMSMFTIFKDTWYQYKGSYNDHAWVAGRAIPHRQPYNVNRPNECIQGAINSRHNMVGLQYYGECWSGSDSNRAKMYGRGYSDFWLGTGWKNQIYERELTLETKVDDPSISSYEETIQWITNTDMGITTYSQFVEFIELINREKFTTIEGLESSLPPISESSSVTAVELAGTMFKSIKIDLENKLSDPLPRRSNSFVFEFSKNTPEFPNLVMDSITELNKLPSGSYDMVRATLKKNEIRNTYEMELLIRDLSKIGYNHKSQAGLYQILDLLNEYGRMGFEVDDAFIMAYTTFGLNSTSDLHKFLTKLIKLKVKHPVIINISETPLPFPSFARLLGKIGVNYTTFDKYCSVMDRLYTPPSATQMEVFIKHIARFYNKSSVNLDEIDGFKKSMAAYKTTYSEYTVIVNDYLSKVNIGLAYRDFFNLFTWYYNTNYIKDRQMQAISWTADSKNTISLHTGIVVFFKDIKRKGFVPNLTVDFVEVMKNYNELNVPGASIKVVNNVIVPKRNGFATMRSDSDIRYSTYEEMTTITEGMDKQKYSMEGYYEALKKMGITNHQDIKITIPYSNNNIPQLQTIQQFDAKLSEYMGARNDVDRVKILSYMVSINAPGTLLYVCLHNLRGIGINMNNFGLITNAFTDLGIDNFVHINLFLEKINQLNVKITTLANFASTLEKFECSYKKSPPEFFLFLDVLLFYDITLTRTIYDNKNTKFDNFMYNLRIDGFNMKRFNEIKVVLFTTLTNTNSMRISIPTLMEKPALARQLKDIIIRKDALLFGIDNTVDGMSSTENLNSRFNSNFKVDTSIDISKLYKNITGSAMGKRTITPLYPVIYEGKQVSNQEVYAIILKGGDYINQATLRTVSHMLTPYEFSMMKTSPQKLHVRSVMSRLCSLLKDNLDKTTPNNDLFTTLLFNGVRTFPYKMFDFLQNHFKYSGNTMDLDNDPNYEGNIYQLLSPVKEPEQLPFTTIGNQNPRVNNESYGNYQAMYPSNVSTPSFAKISDTKLYESYDLSKTSFMNHSVL